MLTFICFLFGSSGVIGTGHYCEGRGFAEEVRELANQLVPVTRRLWQLTKVRVLFASKLHFFLHFTLIKLFKVKICMLLEINKGFICCGMHREYSYLTCIMGCVKTLLVLNVPSTSRIFFRSFSVDICFCDSSFISFTSFLLKMTGRVLITTIPAPQNVFLFSCYTILSTSYSFILHA